MDYFVGVIFIALFVWVAGRSLYLRWWGIATLGTIVAFEFETKGEGDTYKPVVAFTTKENVHIEAKSMYGTAEAHTYFRVGEQVPIRYAANKPTCFAIAGYDAAAVLWCFLFAVIAGALLWWDITRADSESVYRILK